MPKHNPLPHLPLMLAGVPRPAAALLRSLGLPVAPLPRVALTASGTGRFVLFDSLHSASADAARRARAQGLEPIDVRSLLAADPDRLSAWLARAEGPEPAAGLHSPRAAAAVLAFVNELKRELEARGGVWVRVADYPYPWQSALGFTLEHEAGDVDTILHAALHAPPHTAHFLSSKTSPEVLECLAAAGLDTAGWLLSDDEVEHMTARHAERWLARRAAFAQAGLPPVGLALHGRESGWPSLRLLLQLEMQFLCRPQLVPACTVDLPQQAGVPETCVQFATQSLAELSLAAPTHPPAAAATFKTDAASAALHQPHQQIGESHVLGPDRRSADRAAAAPILGLRQQYQSGMPVVLRGTASPTAADEFRTLDRLAAGCSLLWRPRLAEFAGWWVKRRQIDLQVWRRDDGFEVQAAPGHPFERWPAAIEIWRGQHLATLPLKQPVLHVRDHGLVFLRHGDRSPAGCTLPLPVTPHLESNPHSSLVRAAS